MTMNIISSKAVLLYLFLSPLILLGQNLLTTGGGQIDTNNIKMSFSIGEIATTTLVQPNYILTQGFHQSNLTVLKISEAISDLEVSIYPNPATSFLKINCSAANDAQYSAMIYDATGRLLYKETFNCNSSEHIINLQDWAPGAYILNLICPNSTTNNSYKIIKSHG